jgi:hypothetical protein
VVFCQFLDFFGGFWTAFDPGHGEGQRDGAFGGREMVLMERVLRGWRGSTPGQ